jgi:hypothetical protein
MVIEWQSRRSVYGKVGSGSGQARSGPPGGGKSGEQEPWFLATNLTCPKATLRLIAACGSKRHSVMSKTRLTGCPLDNFKEGLQLQETLIRAQVAEHQYHDYHKLENLLKCLFGFVIG